jgi:REP element-mobilizing transposase RayT
VSHSFTNLLYHLVYATKDRHPWLQPDVRPGLFRELGELVRAEGGIPLRINGVEDHVHLLVKLRQDRCLADVLRVLKSRSSFWIHKTFAGLECFGWQTGYGAFTVSQSQVERVSLYIDKQEEHHRTKGYREELRSLLQMHGIDFNEEDLWD